MTDLTTGWVTFYRIPLPDRQVALVQKKNGCTRTIVASSGVYR